MSYLETPGFYTNEPSPYARPDFDSRVPGWGPMAYAAGPSRWGVGAVTANPALRAKLASPKVLATAIKGGATPPAETGGIPWWVWVAVPMAVGGIALFALDQGWFGD
jgi:hypothetical protein